MQKNIDKKFFVSEKIPHELVTYDNLFVLRREYLSSAVNVLTNKLKILHITKRDSFQLNCLHSDQ